MKQQNLTQKLNSNNKCQNHHSVTWPNNTHNKYSACDKNVTTMVECCDTSMVTTHTKKKNLNPLYCYNPWPKKKKKSYRLCSQLLFFLFCFLHAWPWKELPRLKKTCECLPVTNLSPVTGLFWGFLYGQNDSLRPGFCVCHCLHISAAQVKEKEKKWSEV